MILGIFNDRPTVANTIGFCGVRGDRLVLAYAKIEIPIDIKSGVYLYGDRVAARVGDFGPESG